MFKVRTLWEMLSSNRGSVEETDGDVLAAQAYEELAAEKEGREPKDLMPKPEKDGKEEIETPEPDPNEPEIEDVDAAEEKTEEELEGEETDESDPKPEKEGEEGAETPESKDLDAEITAYAEKHSMSYSDAKEDIEKTNKIIEQFKNDPKEMARALRNKDREYDKLKNEVEKKTQEKEKPFQRLNESEFKNVAQQQVEKDPDKFLNAFKTKYPARSELMSDEAILEEMIDKEWVLYQGFAAEKEVELSKKAQSIRDKIISEIPKEDKRFLPEVKSYLEKLNNQDLLQEGFDYSYLLQLAKGKRFDAEIKAAEERGFKRASEGAKILGVKGEGGKQGPSKKGYSFKLNEEQKFRAEEMFSEEDGTSPEKAHQMFIETFKEELSKNPNYV